MNKIQKREMKGILDIGKVLFEEGIKDVEIKRYGALYKISQWSQIELNALTIQKKMDNSYSEPTILKYAKEGKERGFFDIRKCRDLNNADMISLTWWGGCFLFINNRMGLEDFALFLDGWKRIIDRMKKTEYPWDKHRAALKKAGLLNDRISTGIEDMKEASEENSSYNLISYLNKEDKELLEKNLRRLVKNYFVLVEYGLKQDYEEVVEKIFHFIFMSISFEPEEIEGMGLANHIKENQVDREMNEAQRKTFERVMQVIIEMKVGLWGNSKTVKDLCEKGYHFPNRDLGTMRRVYNLEPDIFTIRRARIKGDRGARNKFFISFKGYEDIAIEEIRRDL